MGAPESVPATEPPAVRPPPTLPSPRAGDDPPQDAAEPAGPPDRTTGAAVTASGRLPADSITPADGIASPGNPASPSGIVSTGDIALSGGIASPGGVVSTGGVASLGARLRSSQGGAPAGEPTTGVPRQREQAAPPDDLGAALEALGDRNPAAAQLLCLCSVLHRAPVPVDVFTRSLDRLPRPLGGVARIQFNGLVAALVERGLAQRNAGGLRVPDPVREAVRDDLGEAAGAVCRAYAGALVAAAVPEDVSEPSVWPRWAALAPHLIASGAARSHDAALRAAACQLVVSLLHRGKARPARTIATELHRGWREVLGPDHPDTLRCAHELARSLVAAGALMPARKLLDDTVDRLVAGLGSGHPQTRLAAETRRGVLLRMGGMPRPDGARAKAAHRRRKQS